MSTLCRKTVWMKTGMIKNQRNFQCLIEAPGIWPKILHFFPHRKYCNISQKSQVLLPLLDGFCVGNPHDISDSAARGDAAVHRTSVHFHRGKWEYLAVMATSRKDPQKLKMERAGGKCKLHILQPPHSLCSHGNVVGCFGIQQPRVGTKELC